MQQILNYYWQLCLLRTGPEHAPSSHFALGATFLLFLSVSLLTILPGRDNTPIMQLLATPLIGVAIQAIVLYLLLVFTRLPHRFVASMTALLGANAVVLAITLPLSAYLAAFEEGALRFLVELLFLVAFVWWLAIAGFILHRAAGVSLLQGIVISFGVEMLAITTTFQLFPANG